MHSLNPHSDALVRRLVAEPGGALINLNGELVGINSAIISGGGGNIGIGFAIPSNMVNAVMNQIIEFGEVRRGLLGVQIFSLTPALAKEMEKEDAHGALVSEVSEDSAAAKAGIEPGDVIIEVDGEIVKDSAGLRNTIGMNTLEVRNQNFNSVTVYLYRLGARDRMGVVEGNTTQTYSFDSQFTAVRILMSFLAGGCVLTEELSLVEGDDLLLIVGAGDDRRASRDACR